MRLLPTLLALVFAVLATKSARCDEAPDEITVASWNVEWFFDDYLGDNRSQLAKDQSAPDETTWKWKRDAVAESISRMKPTILALQEIENREVLFGICNVLRDKYDLQYRIAFIEGFDMGTEQDVAFIYLHGLVEYSRREQTLEMFNSRDYYNLSKHLIATFEWQADGKTETLRILNVHFRAKAEAQELRLRQARLARKWMQPYLDKGENVIILGDFNTEELCGEPLKDNSEVAELVGRNTESTSDDLVDAHDRLPQDQRTTHLILPKQFDRIFMSPLLMRDDPNRKNLVFESVEVLPKLVIRGQAADADHWDSRLTKAIDERDVSDHFPILVKFQFR